MEYKTREILFDDSYTSQIVCSKQFSSLNSIMRLTSTLAVFCDKAPINFVD